MLLEEVRIAIVRLDVVVLLVAHLLADEASRKDLLIEGGKEEVLQDGPIVSARFVGILV